MELDDLKGAWLALDRTLDRQHALDLHRFRTGRMTTLRARLLPLFAGQLVQLALGLSLVGLVAPYWAAHWGEWHVVAYGAALHAYGLLLAIFAGHGIVHLLRIDYSAPVLAIQKRLARLRALRQRSVPPFAIAGAFVWVPGLLLAFHALGADLWLHRPAVVAWFVASGVAGVGITIAVLAWSRRRADAARPHDGSIGDRSLARAQDVLEEIARFERA